MNKYELVVLYHPDIEMDLDKALKKVNSAIKDAGGRISFSDNWGKRKLAYQIAKQDYAIYVYHEIELPVEQIRKLETALNLSDEVIRYLLTKPTPNFGQRDEEDAGEARPEKAPEPKSDTAQPVATTKTRKTTTADKPKTVSLKPLKAKKAIKAKISKVKKSKSKE